MHLLLIAIYSFLIKKLWINKSLYTLIEMSMQEIIDIMNYIIENIYYLSLNRNKYTGILERDKQHWW